MINETIGNLTLGEGINGLTFESVVEVTNNPVFILAVIGVWLIPILLYIFIGAVVSAKSPSGQTLSKKMIYYPNFWIPVFIWFFLQSALFLIFIVFPLWLKIN